MAEAIVPHLLSQILYILRREWCRASKYERELETLKVLIESIRQLLKKANSKEAIDEELKASMKRARKFLYDSQDAIDDLMQHESNHQWEGLLPKLYEQFFCGRFASEAKDIREMVNADKIIREIISALDPSGQLSADHTTSSSASHFSPSIAFSEENDNQLVGIDCARKQLVQWLTEDHSMSKVIFVHGAQGLGKTSLVGAVLRDESVKEHFKYYVWIKDLRSYELVEASADVLMEANVEMWNLTKKMWNLTRKANLREQVKLKEAFERMGKDKYRWVLVLDDANKAHVIESLRSYLDPSYPSVLITTRDSSLESCAKKLASASRTSADTQSDGAPPTPTKSFPGFPKFKKVSPKRTYGFHNFQNVSLSMGHPFELFSREMFDKGSCPIDLKEVSDNILKKCEGLPLAILATSDLLKYNQRSRNGNPSNVEWENWNGRLGEELLSKGHRSRLIRRMITLRMDDIHDVHGCFFYLSIFPLDCPIRCSTLMRLWMAERFAMQEGSKTDQEIADENLKKLLERNFIQEVEKTSYGRVRTCRVHNLQHEIIIKKSKDDEFAMIVAGQKEEWPETIWRLSFHSSPHKSESASADESQMDSKEDGTRVKRLRSLFVFKELYPKSMEELLGQADRLNVLHLEASSLISFPKGICSLKYLRYLKLRGTSVETIPKGIRHLAFLETLDLKGTRVRELPDGILELKALRHLLVYRSDRSPAVGTITKHGVKVPPKLGELKSLRKLCLIKLDQVKKSKLSGMVHGKRCGLSLLEELGKLKDLQRLGISELRSEDMGPLCSSIEKLEQLKALHLIAASSETLDLSKVHKMKAPRSLQRVHLTGHLGTPPNWILSCISLTKLVLKECQLHGDLLQHLRELPYLKHLELEQAFDASEMMFEAGKFPQLCFLGLDRFDKLASLNVENGALPTLEKLSLGRCQLLTTVPQDITRPIELKCLELYGMPEQFMTAVKGNKEVHKKMKVVRKDWNNGTVVEVIPSLAHRAWSPSMPPPCKK